MTPRAAPLDLASASLIQDGTKFKLVITTRGSYEPAKLKTRGRRVLCLDVSYGRPRATVGLCVGTLRGRLVLRRRPLGNSGPATRIAATVTRKAARLTATFTPVDAGLPFGTFRWSVRSRWDGGADALPRRGTITARARLLGDPGASARPRWTRGRRAPTRRCDGRHPDARARRCSSRRAMHRGPATRC